MRNPDSTSTLSNLFMPAVLLLVSVIVIASTFYGSDSDEDTDTDIVATDTADIENGDKNIAASAQDADQSEANTAEVSMTTTTDGDNAEQIILASKDTSSSAADSATAKPAADPSSTIAEEVPVTAETEVTAEPAAASMPASSDDSTQENMQAESSEQETSMQENPFTSSLTPEQRMMEMKKRSAEFRKRMQERHASYYSNRPESERPTSSYSTTSRPGPYFPPYDYAPRQDYRASDRDARMGQSTRPQDPRREEMMKIREAYEKAMIEKR
mgnify:FL=1